MKKCFWIRSGLAFGPDKLHVCCINHHGNLGFVPICEYHGGELPIKEILLKRKELSTGNHPMCKDCVFNNSHSSECEYLFNPLNFSHYTFCNLRCKYCYVGINHRYGGNLGARNDYYDIMPVLEKMIENHWLDPHSPIYWGGGEPALLRRFDEILDVLLKYGTYNYLNTNGTIFSKTIFDRLGNKNLEVVVGIDSGLNETYKNIKGHDLLDKVFDNLKRYAEGCGKSKIYAKYIVTDINCAVRELEEFARRVIESGVQNVQIDLDNTLQVQQEHIDAMIILKDLFQGLNVIFSGCGVNGLSNYLIKNKGENTPPNLI